MRIGDSEGSYHPGEDQRSDDARKRQLRLQKLGYDCVSLKAGAGEKAAQFSDDEDYKAAGVEVVVRCDSIALGNVGHRLLRFGPPEASEVNGVGA